VTLSYPRASTALRNATFLKIIKKTREGSICSPLIRRGSSLIVSGTIRDSRHVPMRVAAKFPLSSAKKSYSVSSSCLEHGRIYARRSVTSTPRSKVAVNYVARNDILARNEDLWRLAAVFVRGCAEKTAPSLRACRSTRINGIGNVVCGKNRGWKLATIARDVRHKSNACTRTNHLVIRPGRSVVPTLSHARIRKHARHGCHRLAAEILDRRESEPEAKDAA